MSPNPPERKGIMSRIEGLISRWMGDSPNEPGPVNTQADVQARAGNYPNSRLQSIFGGYPGGGSKWPYGIAGSGTGRVLSHSETRQNARAAFHDSSQFRAIVTRFADTVAGDGLKVEPMPIAEIVGLTLEQAAEWAADISQRYHLFCTSKDQHRSGTMTVYQEQRRYQIGQHRDGETFYRFYYERDPALLNPLQWEYIDPGQIRGDAYTSTYGPHGYDDGIIRDDRGRETAYKIWIRTQGNRYESVEVPARTESGKRIMMIHGYSPEYAGQGRGYARLAYGLQEFQNLTDFKLAQILKAINQSNLVLSVFNKEQAPSNVFRGILTEDGAGPAANQFGSNPCPSSDAQNVTDESLQPLSCYDIPEATLEKPGSTMVLQAARGDEIKEFKNSAPSESFDSFVDSFTAHLAAAGGMPLEVLLMKFNQNYSASRGALLLFWEVAVIWRQEMVSDFLAPMYEMWLAGEIAAGRVQAPGWSDPVIRRAWLNANWIGNPPPDIDPAKTAKARRENVEIGATNLDREAKNLNGSSAASNIEMNRRLFKNFPLAPWSEKSGDKPEEAGESDDDDKQDD
jgi:capsid protein